MRRKVGTAISGRKLLGIVLLGFAAALFFGLHSVGRAITRGYLTEDDNLQPGLVVRIADNSNADTSVTIASRDKLNKILGVVTTVEDSFISITSSERQLYVESDGEVEAYVADLNGEIKTGDFLTLSPLNGVLMKASEGDAAVGIALENFKDQSADSYPVSGSSQSTETNVRKLKINFSLQAFKEGRTGADSSTLKRLGVALVGKEVGELRLVIALLIFLGVLLVEGSIIYGAVSSSMTALGRNPMAKTIIKRELLRVFVVTIFVLITGVAAIYAILWV